MRILIFEVSSFWLPARIPTRELGNQQTQER